MHRAFRRMTTATSILGVVLLTALAGTDADAQTGAASPAVPGARVPSIFKAQSITWTSPKHGWVLGTVPCANPVGCAMVIGTATGSAWSVRGVVPVPIARSGTRGVTEIRMANASDGWLFGPDLFHTANGWRSWAAEPIPGGGKQLLALATATSFAYALVSPCAVAVTCTRPVSVWRTGDLARPKWRQIRLALPPNTSFGQFPAVVAIGGRAVYLADAQFAPKPDAFYASLAGGAFRRRPVPCPKKINGSLADVAAMSGTHVTLLCVIDPGFSQAEKTAYRSSNGGRTDVSAGQTPLEGSNGLLAATNSGTLAVASSGPTGSFIYLNSGGTKWVTALNKAMDGGAGWNDITFSSNTTGWVVYGPADFSDLGIVYRSTNGGHTWRPYTFHQ